TIATRSTVVGARREGDHWVINLKETHGEKHWDVKARMVVNAAGPWIDEVLGGLLGKSGAHNVRLVQGSHIVIPRKFDDPRAYFFQNADGRIIFAIPYEEEFTLIGTTDRDFDGDPRDVRITDGEIDY